MAQFDKKDLERRMNGAVESLKGDLSGLRTGRANTTLLDPVTVEVYGAHMPLTQIATVSAPEPRMLSVQVWDKSNVGPADKAIRSAGLGLNPIVDGQTLRLPIPDLTEERRKELAKLAGQYAEKARIAIRNVRRDGMDSLKTDEKKGVISEDERKRLETEVQKLTDDMIAQADAAATQKEKKSWASDLSARPQTVQGRGAFRSARACRAGPRLRGAPCRDHHGRQWPLGRQAQPAALRRPQAGRRSGAHHRARRARHGARGADALRFLVGKLEASRG
ncbi:MAG: ribosome recycling factor [Blastomonas sp. CACIA14H2]|nr:MAG: ribosome recycling factor [Blastomonas sp. CACIA14H2]